ncbi:MAG TPA: glycosyltransferase, partial [Chthoniobacterales bacterium]
QLIRWLRKEFPKYAGMRLIRALPQLAELRANAEAATRAPGLAGVNILSHFCYASGIQQAAVEAKRALETVGLRTSCRDVPSGVRTRHSPREEWLGFETFPVTITNVAPEPLFHPRYTRAGLAPRSDLLHVAYWAWELDAIPDGWPELAEELDEIWAPTPFVADALRTKMRAPVYEMLPAVGLGEIEEVDRSKAGVAEGEFVFLFMFDMASDFERKNPLAVVRAFRQAFGSNDAARLVLKASRTDFDPDNFDRLRAAAADAKITIIDEFVSRARAYGYIAMCDCAVSLHRSEGFGLLMAEAMLMGKPVIATNYSGNTAFMNAGNSHLVDYELVTIEETRALYRAGYRWAEPSVEHAAKLMRQVFDKREEAQALGARAKAELTPLLAPEAAGQRMKARLVELFANKSRD